MKQLVGRALRTRFFHNITVGAYGQLIQLGVQLAGVPIMIGAWGVETYGVWLMLSAIPAYAAIADFGIGTAAANAMVAHAARGDRARASRAFRASVMVLYSVLGIVAVATAVVLFALAPGLLDFAREATAGRERTTLVLLVVWGLIGVSYKLTQAGFAASDANASAGAVSLTIWLLEAVIALTAVVLGAGLLETAAVYLAVRLIGNLGMRLWLWRHAPWLDQASWREATSELRELWRPAAAAAVLPVATATAVQGSVIALGAIVGPHLVPVFTTARTVTRLPLQMAMVVSLASIQRFTIANASQAHDRKAQLALATIVASALILLPSAALLLPLGPALVSLWTQGDVTVPFAVLVPLVLAMLLTGGWMTLSNLLVAMNRQHAFAYAYLVLAAAGVAVGALASAARGIEGMAWALAAADALMLGWMLRTMRSEHVLERGRLSQAGEMAWRNMFARKDVR